MRKVIIILLVLLVVAGGGAAGLVMLGVVRNPFQSKAAPPVMDAAAKAAAEADAKAKANAWKPPTEAPQLVKAGDLLISVFSQDGDTRRIFVTARLVTTNAAKKRVEEQLPKYVDAALSDLIPYLQNYMKDHDLADLEVLKKRLVKHAKQIYDTDVSDVLLVNVFESGIGSQTKHYHYAE
jgi:hypothetical protein